jgi:hypothetical protein
MRRRLEELERRLREEERRHHHHKHRHHHKDDFTVKLEFDCMSASLTIATGDNGHTASLAVTNADGSPAQNVTITFASDAPSICDVDPTSGALTPTAAGVANITGTGTRLAFTHDDAGPVTVTQDPNTGDFTVTLGLQ